MFGSSFEDTHTRTHTLKSKLSKGIFGPSAIK